LSFYTPASDKPKKAPYKSYGYNNSSSYKNNKKNLDGNDENLLEKFWEELRKRRTFHDGQEAIFKAFFEDMMKYLFLRMGRKATKTTTDIVIAWGKCLQKKNSTCHIVLPTITQAIEVYWDENRLQWCDLQDTDLFDMFVKQVDKSKHIVTFINGSTIKLLGTWSEARSRGTQPDLLLVDEVQDCSSEYLDGAEPNLAAKEDSRCILSGTPPKKRNHYHEWEERIKKNERGFHVHYSSYVNTCLPHLKEWLDNKREELLQAGKEDVWLREYMAEDCFSSDERVLPDISVQDYDEFIRYLRSVDSTAFTPIIGITITPHKLCACYAVILHSKYTGVQMWVLDIETRSRLWDTSYEHMYGEMRKKMDEYSAVFPKSWRQVVYDETESFTDVIPGVTQSRKDIKWKNRGIPLLKEMILNKKASFSTKADQFAVESQNLLKEDDIRDYPTVCALAMLANEYYQPPSLSKDEQEGWDKFAALRESGIVCTPTKRKRKKFLSFNWN
jgi:hypothetical protein